MKYTSFIITGPTASGKSDFAHQLALRVNGTIINCDSVQIYRGIETISASPFCDKDIKDSQIDGIPYKLFSILPLSEQLSVADYLDLAHKEYIQAIKNNRIPIFVGGSGYYINVLINGISPIPEPSSENRIKARTLIKQDIESVKKILSNTDIPTDPQRLSRALEVFLETGKPLTYWQSKERIGAISPTPYKILINPDKEVLLPRISSRVEQMFSGNALKEAKYILDNSLNESRAIGATQLCKMLRGEITQEEAIDNWVIKTNQYAKRQRTWFRTQYKYDYKIPNIPTSNDVETFLETI